MRGLDEARHRARAEGRVVALARRASSAGLGSSTSDTFTFFSSRAAPGPAQRDLLVDHLQDHLRAELAELHHGVEAVAELRGEQRSSAALALRGSMPRLRAEAHDLLAHLPRARVGGHDEHDVAEVGLLAVVVGQRGVVHHLEQDVEELGVGLLDLVQQHHRVGVLVDRVGEQAALVEAHVAGRRADEPRDRVALAVLAHVEAEKLHAQHLRELLGELGLADARGAREEEAADGLLARAQPERASLIARRAASMASSCRRSPLELGLELLERSRSEPDTVFSGMRAIFATMASTSLSVTFFVRSASGRMRSCAPASSMTSMALSGRSGR
jgi:hypothetical protein